MNADPGAARRRRTVGFGAIAVVAALLTSSCAAGRVAQTQNQRPSVSGVNADIGLISVRNLTVEAPQGPSYPKGSALRLIGVFVNNGKSSDVLTDISSTSFSSWGSYSSVTAGDEVVAAASASAAGSATPAAVPSAAPTSATGSTVGSSASSGAPADSTSAATPSASATTSSAPQPSRVVPIPAYGRTSYGVPDATGTLLVLGTTATIYPGSLVTMTLTFARAGTVTVRVPVNITTDPTQSSVPAPSGGSSESG